MGGGLTALSPDVKRAVLGVPGTDYGGLLLQRSSRLRRAVRHRCIKAGYTDHSQYIPDPRPDRAALGPRRGRGYAEHMTTNPLPGHAAAQGADARRLRRPPGQHVLVGGRGADDRRPGLSAARQGARSVAPGARQEPVLRPACAEAAVRRVRNRHLGLGPGRVSIRRPTAILQTTATANDPHSDPRKTVAARQQISKFLNDKHGKIVDVCSNAPCHTASYVP